MKQFKRFVAFSALLVMIFALAGCGKSAESNSKQSAAPTETQVTENTEENKQEDATGETTETVGAQVSESENNDNGILVVYFSRTGEQYTVGVIDKGNTAIVAEMIADATGADMFEIRTDRYYRNSYGGTAMAALVENTLKTRPALAAVPDNLDQYDRATKYDKFLAKHNGLDRPSNAAGGNLHQIYQLNKNYYVVVRSGDTFKSLGKELNISWRKLVRYNELNKHDQLYPGDYIFLKKKQSRAEKQFKGHPHRVRAGESMYDIAQHYGIRLKSLYKLNHMSPDYQIQAGDLLRVR